jgi:hypothetical protein
MKKRAKKMVLAKETVRNLTQGDLNGAAGGAVWPETLTCGCDPWDWIRETTSAYCTI